MLSRRPTKNPQSNILRDPLDGYPDCKPYYTLAFLLLRRLDGAEEQQAASEPDYEYFYRPEDLKRLVR